MYSKKMVPEIEEYILKIAEEDKKSLAMLYEETKTAVYGFALSILKNSMDAEDIMQEVYLKIYENADKYEKQGKPLAWILTITKNLSYLKIKNNKKVEVNIKEIEDVDQKEIIDENKMILNLAFKCLTDEERNIIILHSNSGFKHREISKILEMPLSTVLSKYNRAMKKLKKEIIKEVEK